MRSASRAAAAAVALLVLTGARAQTCADKTIVRRRARDVSAAANPAFVTFDAVVAYDELVSATLTATARGDFGGAGANLTARGRRGNVRVDAASDDPFWSHVSAETLHHPTAPP